MKGEILTKKEHDFVEDYKLHGNGTKSVLKAFDTTDYVTAGSMAYELLHKPKIINALADAIPDALLNEVHIAGLMASLDVTTDDGTVVQKADHAVRHRYLDSAYKLKGSYAAEKSVNLDMTVDMTNPELAAIAEEYEERIKNSL